MSNVDRTLERCKAEWQKTRKTYTLTRALRYCRDRRIADPEWLRDALYRLKQDELTAKKKPGHPTDLLEDCFVYLSVEWYRTDGITLEHSRRGPGAFERAAEDLKLSNEFAAKNAWKRHKDRIDRDPAKYAGLVAWTFKPEFLKHDKNAQDVESWLKKKGGKMHGTITPVQILERRKKLRAAGFRIIS